MKSSRPLRNSQFLIVAEKDNPSRKTEIIFPPLAERAVG
jgi:hypothetical protein